MPGYLGNKKTMIVHNLGNMQSKCSVYEININEREYFTPDTLENSQKLGFSPCPFCN